MLNLPFRFEKVTMGIGKNYKKTYWFVTVLFFLWGFVTVLIDSLIPRLKELFDLNYFQVGMVRTSFFVAYSLLAIPAGFVLSKLGYKRSIILGLLMMALGCFLFYPAASERVLDIFLLAVFVLASGVTFLQVVANPYVVTLGDELGAPSRLNLSQAFNSLGTTIAPIVGSVFILRDTVKSSEEIALLSDNQKETYFATEASIVQAPFLWIGVCLLLMALIFTLIKIPKTNTQKGYSLSSYLLLFKHKGLMFGSIAVFLYVGAEVAIGSFLVNYFIDINIVRDILEVPTMYSIVSVLGGLLGASKKIFTDSDPKSVVGIFVTFYWGGAMLGRFIGAYLTRIMAPARALIIFSVMAILSVLVSINTGGLVSMWSILAVGLFNSIMFPTLFFLSSEGVGDLKPQASGLLCTMIFGGALIPPAFGFFVDSIGFKMAFLSLVVCYGYVLFFGYYKRYGS